VKSTIRIISCTSTGFPTQRKPKCFPGCETGRSSSSRWPPVSTKRRCKFPEDLCTTGWRLRLCTA
jgi:hypothetical protein